jgi:hypothetical protein
VRGGRQRTLLALLERADLSHWMQRLTVSETLFSSYLQLRTTKSINPVILTVTWGIIFLEKHGNLIQNDRSPGSHIPIGFLRM